MSPKPQQTKPPSGVAKPLVRVSRETFLALVQLQAERAQKEPRRPTLGEVVAGLLPAKR